MNYGKWKLYDLLLLLMFAAIVASSIPIPTIAVAAAILIAAAGFYCYAYLVNRDMDILKGREPYTGRTALRKYSMFRLWQIPLIAAILVLAILFPPRGFGYTRNIMFYVRFFAILLVLAPCERMREARADEAQRRRELEMKKRLEQ